MLIIIIIILILVVLSSSSSISSPPPSILVVGSINADIIVPIDRFPLPGETIVAPDHDDNTIAGNTIAGGKGANQAVAVCRLGPRSIFVSQFGNDANADMLQRVLKDNHVDISYCKKANKPSGLGLVFLQKDGSGSAIVIGGSNADWPNDDVIRNDIKKILTDTKNNVQCLMLQMEVPQRVNEIAAEVAEEIGCPVFQDVGGADRDISTTHLKRCTYLSPNLTELKRLTRMECNGIEQIVDAAKMLQNKGAKNVLVTLGDAGSVLVLETGQVIEQKANKVNNVVDETGAGDNFRSSFVVSRYCDNLCIEDCLQFASACSAHSVTQMGAIPSMATRSQGQDILKKANLDISGGWNEDEECPYLFASRLNSMKDRLDLCEEGEANGVLGYINRQGRIKGLDLVDFNYPQHITSPIVTPELKDELLGALDKAKLKCGAICLRFPKLFQAGAFTNPNEELRKKAVQLTKEACDWSVALNANEVVVWSAFCGYDYPLQVDYDVIWNNMVSCFQEVCDSFPNVKVSLEYKPTDENTRYFAVPSTASAQLLLKAINRKNL